MIQLILDEIKNVVKQKMTWFIVGVICVLSLYLVYDLSNKSKEFENDLPVQVQNQIQTTKNDITIIEIGINTGSIGNRKINISNALEYKETLNLLLESLKQKEMALNNQDWKTYHKEQLFYDYWYLSNLVYDIDLLKNQKLIDDSIKTHKVDPLRLHLGYWGADLDFYDRLLAEQHHREGFVSSGKEMRDMDTLVRAFNDEELPLDIYLNRSNGGINYERLFSSLHIKENIKVHFTTSQGVPELARLVNKHSCVVICCQDTKYTVGLTTVVEALALGLPVICSRNLQIPVDFNKEGCGISVPYYDVEEWKNAVNYIHTHPEEAKEMGRKGRALAERLYNDRHCAEVVAQVLKTMNS